MAFEVPDHFDRQFATNVELLVQQRQSYFMGTVSTGSYVGEAAQVVKQFGDVEFVEKTARHSDTEFSELQHKQRWVFPSDWTLTLPIDKEDELKTIIDLKSPYAEAMRAAWGRRWDDTVIAAFFGVSQTGKNGSTATIFDVTNQQILVGAGAASATGLNTEKLIQAREKLTAAEVDLTVEKPNIAVSSKQISDMLRSTEATSADYTMIKRLESGEVNEFMGFRFVRTERLPVNGSSQRRCPVWVPSGIHLGTWNALEARIGERPDKNYLMQVFMRGSIGATRTQEKKVVEVICAES